MRKQLLAVTLFVLALRLPFLNQAIQGDDVYYLYGAAHAQIDPMHPQHARYAFLGQMVDMRGHPHPPLNAWYLGSLLALTKGVAEIPFHAAYIPFSLVAAWAAVSLARRFTQRPLAAALLFLTTPVFVVNGTSLETDLPFVAFWLAAMALYIAAVDRRSVALLAAAAVSMTLCLFTAYQGIVLVPILFLYGRKWKPGWAAILVAPLLIGAWQLYERATSGALPATMLAGYLHTYGLEVLSQKIKSAVALTAHLGWLVFPVLAVGAFRLGSRWSGVLVGASMAAAAIADPNPLFWLSIGVGVLILLWCVQNWREFLARWILLFFAAALLLFFAGSARYLLPIVLPVAILVAARTPSKWLYAGLAAQLLLSVLLARVNYQLWDGYRQFAHSLTQQVNQRRVWINGDWGLRFYLEAQGALPLMAGQSVHPGEMIVSSELAYPLKITTGGGFLTKVAEHQITSPIPLRLVALAGRSAYSTTMFGLRPFDLSTGIIDRVRAEIVQQRPPQLEDLPMNSPASSEQIVSGIYDIENGQWRWMSGKGVVLLKPPAQAEPILVRFYIPPQSPARQVTVLAGDSQVARQVYGSFGSYTIQTGAIHAKGPSLQVTLLVDKTFAVAGDHRELGVILSEVGFVKSNPAASVTAR